MRSSGEKTTAAKLRQKCEISVTQMAEIVGRSESTIQKIECGNLRLTDEVARRMARGTGVSLKWLLDGDTEALPTDAHGKECTEKTFNRLQAHEKIPARWPHEFHRNLIAAGFVARMIAILERGSEYHLCAYKVHKALESLRHEFGQDQKLYPYVDHRAKYYGTYIAKAMPLLKKLVKTLEDQDFVLRNYDALAAGISFDELKKKELEAGQPKPTKKQPSKKRRR